MAASLQLHQLALAQFQPEKIGGYFFTVKAEAMPNRGGVAYPQKGGTAAPQKEIIVTHRAHRSVRMLGCWGYSEPLRSRYCRAICLQRRNRVALGDDADRRFALQRTEHMTSTHLRTHDRLVVRAAPLAIKRCLTR